MNVYRLQREFDFIARNRLVRRLYFGGEIACRSSLVRRLSLLGATLFGGSRIMN